MNLISTFQIIKCSEISSLYIMYALEGFCMTKGRSTIIVFIDLVIVQLGCAFVGTQSKAGYLGY